MVSIPINIRQHALCLVTFVFTCLLHFAVSGDHLKNLNEKTFQIALGNYDIFLTGRTTCWFTRTSISELEKRNASSFAYTFFDVDGNQFYWALWKEVYATGFNAPTIQLPFGFVCGKYVGGKEELLRLADTKCDRSQNNLPEPKDMDIPPTELQKEDIEFVS